MILKQALAIVFHLSHPFLSNQNRMSDTVFIVIFDDLKRAWTFKFYVYTWRLASKFSKPEMFVLMRVGGFEEEEAAILTSQPGKVIWQRLG